MDIKLNKPYKDNTHLRIEIYYDLGGTSPLSGNPSPRGFYLSVNPIAKSEHSVQMAIPEEKSFRGLIKEVSRNNKKKLSAMEERLNAANQFHVLSLWKGSKYTELAEYIMEVIEQPVSTPKVKDKMHKDFVKARW